MKGNMETAVFGGGCFWCTEAVFKMMRGVVSVLPGYAGGGARPEAPTYEEVCSGSTGFAEVVKVEFDPSQIEYRDLLSIFFGSHDPTTKDRQGNDVGSQYRSVVFYTTDAQKAEARAYVNELNGSAAMGAPVVTDVEPLDVFYVAEDYHKDYFARNPGNPYCEVVINPKLQKAVDHFAELLKTNIK